MKRLPKQAPGNGSAEGFLFCYDASTPFSRFHAAFLTQPEPPLLSTRQNIHLAAFFVAVTYASFWTTPGYAQGVPKVITMQSGARYEGLIGSIGEMHEGTGVPDPFDAKPIVVINDGLRRVFVRDNRIQGNLADSNRNEIALDVFQRLSNAAVDFGGSILRIGPFDQNGHRLLTMRDPRGRIQTLVQGITLVTPRFCEVKTLVRTPRQWSMRIGTGTVPTSVLIPLLKKQISDPNDLTAHQKIADFLIQAGYYQLASDELRLIQQRFPDDPQLLKDIERTRRLLKQQAARQILAEARLRLSSGQTDLAEKFLTSAINVEGVAGEILAEFRELQNQSAQQVAASETTRQNLERSLASMADLSTKQKSVVKRLTAELATDLNQVNAARLDAWRRFADDPNTKPQQKLALAISGWLLGSNGAITNLAVSESLFDVRDLVVDYLNTTKEEAARRDKILKQLESFESGTPPFLADLIAQMTPPSPPPLETLGGAEPISVKISIPGPQSNPDPIDVECLALVPPQYDPYRRYPLLVALSDRPQPLDELNAWCGRYNPKLQVRTGQAMRHGYIVIVVPWHQDSGQQTNKYSAYEHAVVLKALRESMRKFSVDSDRVFLVGRGIGGNVAYDVGLSHPEHWAGVAAVSGELDQYLNVYAGNTHVPLPVLSIIGDENAQSISASKNVWNKWFSSRKYVDNTVFQYIGHANNAIVEAIPAIFDWTKLHKRRWPSSAGFEFEVKTMRPWDNYFWFLEVDVPAASIVWPEKYRDRKLRPYKINGTISPDRPNEFQLLPNAAPSRATLWLSPNYIDFSKEITIKGMGRDFRGFAQPSRKTLLEDVRTRADRQRPYWAKFVCQDGVWSVQE